MRPDEQATPARRVGETGPSRSSEAADRGSTEVDSLRDEIEQTRGEMTETVEAIEQKLRPEQLTDQAKEIADYAVRQATEQAKSAMLDVTEQAKEAAKEITDHAIGEARTAVHDLAGQAKASVRAATIGKVESVMYETQDRMNEAQSSVVDLVKQNPVASALVGIGLGWLVMNRGGNAPRRQASYGPSRYAGGRAWERGAYSGENRGGLERTFEEGESAVRGALDRAQDTAEDVVDQVQDVAYSARGTATDIGAGLMDIIRRNPVPSALAGLSIGYLLINGSGATQTPIAYRARSEAERATGQVRGTTERVADEVQDTAEDIAGRVQSAAGRATGQVQQTAEHLGSDLDYQALRTKMRLEELVNENPLLVGAAAFVLGAAVGLPVPQTQQESSLMGSASSQVIDRAQSAAQGAVRRVQHVAEEAANTAEREARNQGLAS